VDDERLLLPALLELSGGIGLDLPAEAMLQRQAILVGSTATRTPAAVAAGATVAAYLHLHVPKHLCHSKSSGEWQRVAESGREWQIQRQTHIHQGQLAEPQETCLPLTFLPILATNCSKLCMLCMNVTTTCHLCIHIPPLLLSLPNQTAVCDTHVISPHANHLYWLQQDNVLALVSSSRSSRSVQQAAAAMLLQLVTGLKASVALAWHPGAGALSVQG